VVLGTLAIQGLTLGPLLRALDLCDDDPVGQERRLARTRALAAGLAALDGDDSAVAEAVRGEFSAHLAEEAEHAEASESVRSEHGRLHRQAVQAARRAVLVMRERDEIGDDAFHEVEEELDWLEMADGGKDI
jgi:CPA1 family monovalent cation:H+ antiporter